MFSVEICENELLPVSIYRRDIAPGAYTVTTNSKVLYGEEDNYLLLVGWNGSMIGIDLADSVNTSLRDFSCDELDNNFPAKFHNVKPVKSVRFVVER
jgi:hypothetical protein